MTPAEFKRAQRERDRDLGYRRIEAVIHPRAYAALVELRKAHGTIAEALEALLMKGDR